MMVLGFKRITNDGVLSIDIHEMDDKDLFKDDEETHLYLPRLLLKTKVEFVYF